MTDNFPIPQSDPELDSPKSLSGRLNAVLATSRGRMIAGGVGLVVMLALLAVVVFVFLLKPQGPAAPPVATATSATTTTTPVEQAPPVNRPAKPIAGEFAFRDIFEPTFVPAEQSASGSTTDTSGTDNGDSGDNGSGADTSEQDTLYLVSVATVDGHATGRFVWNGETFEAAAGDQLGETPWSVEDIEGDSVTMLYGDSRVTLTVGQGLSK